MKSSIIQKQERNSARGEENEEKENVGFGHSKTSTEAHQGERKMKENKCRVWSFKKKHKSSTREEENEKKENVGFDHSKKKNRSSTR
jgi:hypothetical protein